MGREGPKINKQLTTREWWCFSATKAMREDELTAQENSAVSALAAPHIRSNLGDIFACKG